MILLLASLALVAPTYADSVEYTLVVNTDVPDKVVSYRDFRKMLSKQNCCWSDGLEVTLVLAASGDESVQWFTQEYAGLDPAVYRRYVIERCYRVGCTPMVGVVDLATAQDVASRTPGALTIARKGEVAEGLRELTIKK